METTTTPDLKTTWAAFREANPKVRIRNAAEQLGTSEAELLATSLGETVTRLRPDWYEMLFDLEALGEVMALTRNDVFVHEKTGRYSQPSIFKSHQMGQTLDKGIDLRIFFRTWGYAFAVVVPDGNAKTRRSLQFFDVYGNAVHKTFLRRKSDVDYFDTFVEKYRHDEQSPALDVTPQPAPKPEKPDDEVDAEGLRQAWAALKDTHEFFRLLHTFGVTRTQAFRLAGPEFARRVDTSHLRTVLEAASAQQIPLMIFAGNDGCIQIHTGHIKKLKDMYGWYNILDPGFNLHMKDGDIDSTWVVRKPTVDGDVHSLECYDANSNVLCYIFGSRKESNTELPEWRSLLLSLE
ncbi:MAG: ChuX/HutX family heme-like substrate-binding protein [Bacteroidota bacterium]